MRLSRRAGRPVALLPIVGVQVVRVAAAVLLAFVGFGAALHMGHRLILLAVEVRHDELSTSSGIITSVGIITSCGITAKMKRQEGDVGALGRQASPGSVAQAAQRRCPWPRGRLRGGLRRNS